MTSPGTLLVQRGYVVRADDAERGIRYGVLQAGEAVANAEVDDPWVAAEGAEKTARFDGEVPRADSPRPSPERTG